MAAPVVYFSYSTATYTTSIGTPASALTVTATVSDYIPQAGPSALSDCSVCADNGMIPGALPNSYYTTQHTAQPSASTGPKDPGSGGVLAAAPTSQDAIWYCQPWTLSAACLLLVYSLLSLGALWLLLVTRKVDWKLNKWIAEPSPQPRSRREDLLELWGVTSSWDEAMESLALARRQSTTARPAFRRSNVSFAETVIDFGEDEANDLRQQQASRPRYYRGGAASELIEMQTLTRPSYISPLAQHLGREGHDSQTADLALRHPIHRVTTGAHDPYRPRAWGIRYGLSTDEHEAQLEAWRLHELHRSRMGTAGGVPH